MARALQRQLRSSHPVAVFRGFPRHWLPVFEWAGAPWRGSIDPPEYVPHFSGRSESEIVAEIARARAAGQLRLLAEVAASSEVVLCETLQRIDENGRARERGASEAAEIRFTTWHSYGRADVRSFDSEVAGFEQSHPIVLFIPCAKARPYHRSQSYRRLLSKARAAGIDVECADQIVITSLGPVPQQFWDLDIVQRYDTGVRDVYRLFLQTKALLSRTRYRQAWDLMSFVPYSDILRLLHVEGVLPALQRLPAVRRRNIPVFRRRHGALP
jgi:Domain of unknown function (DUF5591)